MVFPFVPAGRTFEKIKILASPQNFSRAATSGERGMTWGKSAAEGAPVPGPGGRSLLPCVRNLLSCRYEGEQQGEEEGEEGEEVSGLHHA